MTVSELIKELQGLEKQGDGDFEVYADGWAISGALVEKRWPDACALEGYAFLDLDRPE